MDSAILILILLIFASAFFSGIESAFISLGEIDLIEIEKSKAKNRKILLQLIGNKERLLSTILIGNNLVNIGASALNTALAIHYAPILGVQDEVAVTVATIGLTLIILMFGEISPKSVALLHNRNLALLGAPIVLFLSWLFRPASILMELASRALTKFSGAASSQHNISEKTVIHVVHKGEQLGVINEREKDLIENVFHFDEREVYPIMTPRTKVFALKEHLTLDEAKQSLMERQYSRVPIYSETIDQITGVLNLKLALKELICGNNQLTLKELAQKATFVPETLSIAQLLERFQEERIHIAIVVDEYGGMSGIVTLEDILEELVGEIYDEKDHETPHIRVMGTQKWLVSGRQDLLSINRELPGVIPTEGDFESVQGLIMSHLQRIPTPGDVVQIGSHTYRVMKMKGNEVLQVMIEYHPHMDVEE